MSRRGNCRDNAVMERFFRSLKTESISRDRYQTKEEVGWAVNKHIHFRNSPAHPFRRRRHVAQPGRATFFETGLTGCPKLLDHYRSKMCLNSMRRGFR